MYRLIYKSHCTQPIDWELVRAIQHESEEYNSTHQITGLLLATDTRFLQVIEGRYEDVNRVFMRIARDDRHADIQLVSFNIVDARLFEGWGMKGIGVFDLNEDLEKRLVRKYGAEDDGSLRFPLEEWLVLAMIFDIKMINEIPEWKT